MLILFDIDMTLIRTSRSGLWSMEQAGRELFGPGFSAEGIDFAGRLDTLIIPEMFASISVQPTPDNIAKFRARYRALLAQRLADASVQKVTLPGVPELLSAVRSLPGVTIGLLTGNFAETGRLKIESCGIDSAQFIINAFAEDAIGIPPSRDELPRVAMKRYFEHHRHQIDPARVTILGDSPHDIRCAKVNGCRSLAVATGHHSIEELRRHEPHKAVSDLSKTAELVTWLVEG